MRSADHNPEFGSASRPLDECTSRADRARASAAKVYREYLLAVVKPIPVTEVRDRTGRELEAKTDGQPRGTQFQLLGRRQTL